MQRVNVVVLNPLFLGVFVGTAALGVASVVASLSSWSTPRSLLLLAAALFGSLGSFLVTMVCNVPMNNRLARLDPASTEAAAYWPVYVRELVEVESCAYSGIRRVGDLRCPGLGMLNVPEGLPRTTPNPSSRCRTLGTRSHRRAREWARTISGLGWL